MRSGICGSASTGPEPASTSGVNGRGVPRSLGAAVANEGVVESRGRGGDMVGRELAQAAAPTKAPTANVVHQLRFTAASECMERAGREEGAKPFRQQRMAASPGG